jgi:hypothetical protein
MKNVINMLMFKRAENRKYDVDTCVAAWCVLIALVVIGMAASGKL